MSNWFSPPVRNPGWPICGVSNMWTRYCCFKNSRRLAISHAGEGKLPICRVCALAVINSHPSISAIRQRVHGENAISVICAVISAKIRDQVDNMLIIWLRQRFWVVPGVVAAPQLRRLLKRVHGASFENPCGSTAVSYIHESCCHSKPAKLSFPTDENYVCIENNFLDAFVSNIN